MAQLLRFLVEYPAGESLKQTAVGERHRQLNRQGGARRRSTKRQWRRWLPNLWGQWALGKTGLYFVEFSSGGPKVIRRLDLMKRTILNVVKLNHLPVQYDSGMALSPGKDGCAGLN